MNGFSLKLSQLPEFTVRTVILWTFSYCCEKSFYSHRVVAMWVGTNSSLHSCARGCLCSDWQPCQHDEDRASSG